MFYEIVRNKENPSPLILRSAVPIATFMCLVLKHLAYYFPFSFSLLRFAYMINIRGPAKNRSSPRRTPNSSSWQLHESISEVQNPIYMRSTQSKSGFSRLCDSEIGGDQGDAVTCLIFVLLLIACLRTPTQASECSTFTSCFPTKPIKLTSMFQKIPRT